MKNWTIWISLMALVTVIGLGCSSKSDDDDGPKPLSSSASPAPGLYENGELPMSVSLIANKAGALIYYTSGGSPADPTLASSVYNPSTPLTIDTGYTDSTFIVKFFAYLHDGVTGATELEDPFNTATYIFKPDIKNPTCSISPSSGGYSDPADVTITITVSDSPNDPSTVTIKYTMDGSDPKTSGTVQTATGPSTTVPWTDGDLTVKAYAIDAALNESNVVTRNYSIDTSGWAQEVMDLINADRDAAGGKPPLVWNQTWADACEDHSYGLEQAGETNPSPDDYDYVGNQLLDFDDDDQNYYLDNVSAYAFGTTATGPDDFYNKIKAQAQLWAELMEDNCQQFGCGFSDDTWEMLCTYTP